MKVELLLAGTLFAVVFLWGGANSGWTEEMKISNEQAIDIATKEVGRLGYNSKFMNMEATFHRLPWNRFLPQEESTSDYTRERQNKLIGKEYWAIYYYPRPSTESGSVKGGDVCIFVDSKTGKILTNYRGE